MMLRECDIHNHLLPGVDDGFKHEDDSLRAIQKMACNGCRSIVFSPHINPDVSIDTTEDVCRAAFERFSPQIPAEWNVSTYLAAEYMVVAGFEDRVVSSADSLLTYPDGSILIEMSYFYRSKNLEQAIFELNMAGLKPILAHPERYLYMSDTLSDFDHIVQMGCRLQMNMMSLTGVYGQQSLKILDYLIKNKMYSFMATDLHTLSQLDKILSFKPGFLLRRKLGKLSLT